MNIFFVLLGSNFHCKMCVFSSHVIFSLSEKCQDEKVTNQLEKMKWLQQLLRKRIRFLTKHKVCTFPLNYFLLNIFYTLLWQNNNSWGCFSLYFFCRLFTSGIPNCKSSNKRPGAYLVIEPQDAFRAPLRLKFAFRNLSFGNFLNKWTFHKLSTYLKARLLDLPLIRLSCIIVWFTVSEIVTCKSFHSIFFKEQSAIGTHISICADAISKLEVISISQVLEFCKSISNFLSLNDSYLL